MIWSPSTTNWPINRFKQTFFNTGWFTKKRRNGTAELGFLKRYSNYLSFAFLFGPLKRQTRTAYTRSFVFLFRPYWIVIICRFAVWALHYFSSFFCLGGTAKLGYYLLFIFVFWGPVGLWGPGYPGPGPGLLIWIPVLPDIHLKYGGRGEERDIIS